MNKIDKSLVELRRLLQTHSLDSLRTFRALGQLAIDRLPDRKARYDQAILKRLGATLQAEFTGVFPSGDLTARLQAAARVARAFTAKEILALERRGTNEYRLRVSHLRYLASAEATKRDRWVDSCFQKQWTARQLHAALKKAHYSKKVDPLKTKGGRIIKVPEAGFTAILQAIQAVERHFARAANGKRRLSEKKQNELFQLHAKCRQQLNRLRKVISSAE